MKHCWKCSTSKPKIDFGVNKSKPDGLATECRNCKRQQDREYAARNREAAKKRASEWYYNNYTYAREKQNQYSKTWSKENLDKKCSYENKRRAMKLNATPSWLSKEQEAEIQDIYEMAKELEKVFPWKQHVDHIAPLKGKTVCGLHVPWNLQILSVTENLKKGNRFVA